MTAPSAPLAGIRVLDCGIITAGAATAAILADAGAEVLKIESHRYQDPFRLWFGPETGDPSASSAFDCNNRNKLGVGLDLKHPRGRELFLRLVTRSDVIVENFRRGVMEKLGLGYETLRAANPRIILASISIQGIDGPDSTISSYGSTLEAMGGLAAITGTPEGAPLVTGRNLNFPDQAVSIFAAGAIAAAIIKAQRDGQGAHIDLSQRELTVFLLGDIASQDLNLSPFDSAWRKGNADPAAALQGCYRAKDDWVAVAAYESATLLELAETTCAPREMTGAALEAHLSAWMSQQHSADAVSILRRSGLFAAVVPHSECLLPEFTGERSSIFVNSPSGRIVKGSPFSIANMVTGIARNAPRLGEDTREVLTRVLGLSVPEIDYLATEQAIDV